MGSSRIQFTFPAHAEADRFWPLYALAAATFSAGMLMMYVCHSLSCTRLIWTQSAPTTALSEPVQPVQLDGGRIAQVLCPDLCPCHIGGIGRGKIYGNLRVIPVGEKDEVIVAFLVGFAVPACIKPVVAAHMGVHFPVRAEVPEKRGLLRAVVVLDAEAAGVQETVRVVPHLDLNVHIVEDGTDGDVAFGFGILCRPADVSVLPQGVDLLLSQGIGDGTGIGAAGKHDPSPFI